MIFFRYLLAPIAGIYWLITVLRNALYERRIFKSSSFDIPIICVGNLSMGGTGKTPHTEYLIRLLQDEFKTVTLSRGYGRKSSGFLLAEATDNATTIGDEPAQYFRKFPAINVAVEKKRVLGALFIFNTLPETDVVLLDDAFQHRALKAGLNILITDYGKPFYKDNILPIGDLRESSSAKHRADIIIVSKCPTELTAIQRDEITRKIDTLNIPIFFSSISYKRIYDGRTNQPLTSDLKEYEILLVTGIAKPAHLETHLKALGVVFKALHFKDHHRFTKKDFQHILEIFNTFTTSKKIVLTTEKDFSRMLCIPQFENLPIYCQEIEIQFLLDRGIFDTKIVDYVRANKTDHRVFEGENPVSTLHRDHSRNGAGELSG